ncbi:etoposide-induced protein 2.4 homolog [Lucilia sericata]|uniref:etoposide-induced protein 2.4 homolog n=1 Tax=Lucilia sericata TaxID=13632 RepID=UPI0018A81228|nr:etoposide-induced protein 2.4 homolog [Lucilia sericata]
MDSIKTVSLAFFYGLCDSIKGMTLVFYIDAEIHRQKAEEEAQRQLARADAQLLESRHGTARRSPSPVPSSASAMFEEELQRERSAINKENPDERRLDSLRKKQKPAEPSIPFKEKKIAKQVLKCCALNGGFTWMSIILFEQILLPTLKFILTLCYGDKSQDLHMIWGWLQSILSIIFGMMWVLPIFLLSKIVSSLWFADIANEAYKVRKGPPSLIPNISKLVADFLFSLVVQAIFLVQSMLVNLLPFPYVGEVLCFVHLCLLYSLYSFEYKWFNMGWELHRRLSYIEINWPYFMGFGVPLTVLTNMSSSVIVSSCIFSIFFPLFILSGNEAKPVIGTTDTPLRLFSPTIFVSNLMFGGRKANITASKLAQHKKHNQQQQQLLQKQRNQLHRRSSAKDNSPSPSPSLQIPTPQFRYPQPPQRISPARLTPERQFRSDFSRTQIRYNEGTRTLIPTPVPGAPVAPTTTQAKSTNQRR